jgi:imidazolonepropionase-like amidohydrolase
LVKAGLSPQEALQVTTRDSSNISQLGDSKGQIKTGFDADILLVNGDPTKNMSDIRQLVMVITQGNAYYRSKIYEYMGIKPFTDDLPSITKRASAK